MGRRFTAPAAPLCGMDAGVGVGRVGGLLEVVGWVVDDGCVRGADACVPAQPPPGQEAQLRKVLRRLCGCGKA